MVQLSGKKKRIIAICSFTVILVVGSEIFLREKYGFCDAVLMQEDPNFEYIAQPNQDRHRLGNHIQTNSLSMRSSEIDKTAVKILGFGDSVFNGGTQTDNDSLASTILTKSLSEIQHKKVQFLNISAGSWGADNCFAYLKKYGNFNAKSIFLFVSSHDAYDNMNFQKTVDVHESFPSKQYTFAIAELLGRYIFPRIRNYFSKPKSEEEILGINKKKDKSTFNTGFLDFYNYSIQNKIPLTIYLHAEKIELEQNSYNEQGKEIITFAKEHNIPLITDLDNGLSESDFRDNIHVNAKGQKKMAELILKNITE